MEYKINKKRTIPPVLREKPLMGVGRLSVKRGRDFSSRIINISAQYHRALLHADAAAAAASALLFIRSRHLYRSTITRSRLGMCFYIFLLPRFNSEERKNFCGLPIAAGI